MQAIIWNFKANTLNKYSVACFNKKKIIAHIYRRFKIVLIRD